MLRGRCVRASIMGKRCDRDGVTVDVSGALTSACADVSFHQPHILSLFIHSPSRPRHSYLPPFKTPFADLICRRIDLLALPCLQQAFRTTLLPFFPLRFVPAYHPTSFPQICKSQFYQLLRLNGVRSSVAPTAGDVIAKVEYRVVNACRCML